MGKRKREWPVYFIVGLAFIASFGMLLFLLAFLVELITTNDRRFFDP